jgi:hypothetical protein
MCLAPRHDRMNGHTKATLKDHRFGTVSYLPRHGPPQHSRGQALSGPPAEALCSYRWPGRSPDQVGGGPRRWRGRQPTRLLLASPKPLGPKRLWGLSARGAWLEDRPSLHRAAADGPNRSVYAAGNGELDAMPRLQGQPAATPKPASPSENNDSNQLWEQPPPSHGAPRQIPGKAPPCSRLRKLISVLPPSNWSARRRGCSYSTYLPAQQRIRCHGCSET